MNFIWEAHANQKSWRKAEAKRMNLHSFLFSSNACLEPKRGPPSSGLRSSSAKLLQRDKEAFVFIWAKHDLVTGSSPWFLASAIWNICLCKNMINKGSQRLSCLPRWNRDLRLHPQTRLGLRVLAQIINSPIKLRSGKQGHKVLWNVGARNQWT